MVAVHVDTCYIQNLDPVIFQVGPLALRWYGLAYVGGFVAVILLLRQFARLGISKLPEAQAADFVTFAALFGVMLGGRLGYALFYSPSLFTAFRSSFPWWDVLAINEGGMASHGGIIGLMAFTFWYSRRHKIPWTHLGDNLVVGAPLGILFGRLANFINGELYGRAADGFRWAVKFPQEILPNYTHPGLSIDDSTRATVFELAESLDPAVVAADPAQVPHAIIERMRDNPELRSAVGAHLTPRHASQLYEAALEGLLLFAILYAVRRIFPRLRDGILTALFFIFYAIFRIVAEQFREPDSEMVWVLTKGQFYSVFMIGIGMCFLVWALRRPLPKSIV